MWLNDAKWKPRMRAARERGNKVSHSLLTSTRQLLIPNVAPDLTADKPFWNCGNIFVLTAIILSTFGYNQYVLMCNILDDKLWPIGCRPFHGATFSVILQLIIDNEKLYFSFLSYLCQNQNWAQHAPLPTPESYLGKSWSQGLSQREVGCWIPEKKKTYLTSNLREAVDTGHILLTVT